MFFDGLIALQIMTLGRLRQVMVNDKCNLEAFGIIQIGQETSHGKNTAIKMAA